jgi:DNA-binding transcriptional LysR family regulator
MQSIRSKEVLLSSSLDRQIGLKLPQLDLRSIIIFYLIASEGNFTRAAERLHLSEPALSRRVRSLERQLGLKLFLFKNRAIDITDVGELVLRYGAEAYGLATELERRLARLKRHRLKIGVCESLVPLVARAIADVLREYKDIDIAFDGGGSFEIAQQTAYLVYDTSFVYSVASRFPNLQEEKLCDRQNIVLVTSTKSTDLKDNMNLRDICDRPFIVGPEKSGNRYLLLEALKQLGLASSPVLVTVNSLGSGIAFAENGVGILATNKCAVQEAILRGSLRLITSIEGTGISVVKPKNAETTDAEKMLVSLVKHSLQMFESGLT